MTMLRVPHPCMDCGTIIPTPTAKRCLSCSKKGSLNPIFGTTRPQRVRDAISVAHKGVPEPRTRRRVPRTPKAGRAMACRLYAKPDSCDRCGTACRLDWHHIDGNPLNNDRENLSAVCRRCHMAIDGRAS